MPQPVPGKYGSWTAPAKPQPANTGGDVLQLPTTGDPHIDQVLRQMADFMISTQRQTQAAILQHADSITSLQDKAPVTLQHELSTKGSAPLNISGLLGTPSVLSTVPVVNSGAAAAVQAPAFNSGDPGPQSLTAKKFKQFTEKDGTVYFQLLFQ